MLRLKYGGLNLVDSDIRFTNKNLASLIGLGFGGGIVAGAFGLGGGTIFNPILLTMGLPP
jgi:uncharacterized membrane protein YfcA